MKTFIKTVILLFLITSTLAAQDVIEGRWVEGNVPASPRRLTRFADYCPDCAARLFPGVFGRQAGAYPLEEERVAAVR